MLSVEWNWALKAQLNWGGGVVKLREINLKAQMFIFKHEMEYEDQFLRKSSMSERENENVWDYERVKILMSVC